MKKIELLAPAGDLNRLKTAVRYGADAVFIGGKIFSLRSRASNFDLNEIKKAVLFAHEYGSKVYVTVNMIMHEEDLPGLDEYLIALEQSGVDAIICSSLFIAQRAHRVAPLMEVHISTQNSISNSYAAEIYKDNHATRIVLAREATLQQIELLNKNTDLEVEVFAHGGMCTNFSGHCTLSNYMTLRDANRGGCAQSCRWQYHIFDGDQEISDNQYLFTMGSKDLSAMPVLDQLINTGVASLKIEGRMKTEYYIATVVGAYRRAIDDLYAGKNPEEVIAQGVKELTNAANRETFTGFLEKIPEAEGQLYLTQAETVTQNYIGRVITQDPETLMTTIELRNAVEVNDRLESFGPRRQPISFVVETMLNSEGEAVTRSFRPMEHIQIQLNHKVLPMDFIRRY